MKLVLDVYNAICDIEIFEINGIKATYKDFGSMYDAAPDQSKPCHCGNMIFESRIPSQQVLQKYGINVSEYAYICQQLQEQLSFGLCRLCS
ncbi:MAG: hypothetical protein N2484_00560 [Clostridia bacterium]|nr:hypothetical protein [Clostridia bacterium]